jgi:hypothetical protein
MPIDCENNYYDFEELSFESGCDIDNIINNFFSKYNDVIKGDREYITYKIKNTIASDRKILMDMNGQGQDALNRIGKVSYVRHDVIPDLNNGKEFYVYSIHSFIPVTPPVLSI